VRALLAGLLLAAAAPGRAAQEKPVFSAATQLVTIDVVVVDRDGRPVRGLAREDFQVADAGEPQTISHFEAVGASNPAPAEAGSAVSGNAGTLVATPRTFVLVYDDLHVSALRAADARAAVDSFLGRDVRPGDRVAVVITGSGAWWTADVPDGLADLRAFLAAQSAGRSARSGEGMTDSEAQRIAEYDDTAVREWVVDRWVRQGKCEDLCQYTSPCDPREGRRACSDQVRGEALRRNATARSALQRALAAMAKAMDGVAAERGRKSLVLVSEGFVFDPRNHAYREVVQASLRANTAIHFLDVRGLAAGSPTSDVGHRGDADDSRRAASEESALAAAGAEQVAEESGGFAIGRGTALAAGLARLAGEAESYYLLGYEPPLRPGRPGLRKLTVRVARDGVRVRARQGYFVDAAGRVEGVAPATASPSARNAAGRDALAPSLVPRQEIRVRAAAYVGPPADRTRTKVRLVAEVDRSSLGAAGGDVSIELRGDVWPRAGQQWVGLDRRVKVDAKAAGAASWQPLTWDIALAPGVYQARLRLRDPASGREGALVHRFEVGEARGLRFATPIVTDTLHRDGSGAPSLVASASRSFESGPDRSLYVQLELLGVDAGPGTRGIDARVALRDDGGREVRAVPWGPVPADPAGRLVRAIGFGLDDVPPGRYVLVLEGRDERSGAACRHAETVVLRGLASR
jgi:VWFA-related protein